MGKEHIPTAFNEKVVHLLDREVPCAAVHTPMGVRYLVTERGMLNALGRSEKAPARSQKQTNRLADKIPVFVGARNLKPFISNALSLPTNPVIFKSMAGPLAHGYDTDLLPGVLLVYFDALMAGKIHKSQMDTAQFAVRFVRASVHSQFEALVKSAFGLRLTYTQMRRILNKHMVREEFWPYRVLYPRALWVQLCRLLKLAPAEGREHEYRFFAQIINEIVYEKLGPEVLEELRRVNKMLDSGSRGRKHFQHLNNLAVKELVRWLDYLVAEMDNFEDFESFRRYLHAAHPSFLVSGHLDFGAETLPLITGKAA